MRRAPAFETRKPIYRVRIFGYPHHHVSPRNDRFAPKHDLPRRGRGERCALIDVTRSWTGPADLGRGLFIGPDPQVRRFNGGPACPTPHRMKRPPAHAPAAARPTLPD